MYCSSATDGHVPPRALLSLLRSPSYPGFFTCQSRVSQWQQHPRRWHGLCSSSFANGVVPQRELLENLVRSFDTKAVLKILKKLETVFYWARRQYSSRRARSSYAQESMTSTGPAKVPKLDRSSNVKPPSKVVKQANTAPLTPVGTVTVPLPLPVFVTCSNSGLETF